MVNDDRTVSVYLADIKRPRAVRSTTEGVRSLTVKVEATTLPDIYLPQVVQLYILPSNAIHEAEMTTKSFKAILTIQGPTPKQEIRRFDMDNDVASSYLALHQKIMIVFPKLLGKDFTISWKDNDGDEIAISSDDELRIAIGEMEPYYSVRKLYITLHSDADQGDKEISGADVGVEHFGIVCDGCEKKIYGFRYKCLQCPDFDLCQYCEAKGLHAKHCMIRTPFMVQWLSSHGKSLLYDIFKFINKSEKSSARGCSSRCGRSRRHPTCDFVNSKFMDECAAKQSTSKQQECAPESAEGQKQDKPEEIDLLPDFKPAFQILGQVITNVLKTASNVAATASESATKASENVGQASASTNTEATQKENERARECPVGFESFSDMNKLKQHLESLATLMEQVPKSSQDEHNTSNASTGKSTPQVSSPPSEKNTESPGKRVRIVDEKMEIGFEAQTESKNKNIAPIEKQQMDTDEWTIVNATESTNCSPSSSAPASRNGTPPKQHVASAPAMEATQNENVQSIYPPLPGDGSAFYHSDPRIQWATESMMAMGFSNDGGWLTQLLVSNGGDISKTLDILQPKQRS